MDLGSSVLQSKDILVILTGIVMGTIGRIITLEIDFRQTPSYPNGYFIHLIAGLIASALGSVAIPALLSRDFAAITFLALALEQFREIRKLEAESLERLETTELTPRGEAYIDGIAKTFEARNYISLLVSVATVLVMTIIQTSYIVINVLAGVLTGFLVLFLLRKFTKGKTVGDLCNVKSGIVTIDGSELYVDGIFVSNHLGLDNSRELFLKEGIGLVIEPKQNSFRITLDNYGQRQAILFEVIRTFGVKRYNFTRRSFTTGKIIIAFIPVIHNIDKIIEVVKQTPILENSRKVRRIMKTL